MENMFSRLAIETELINYSNPGDSAYPDNYYSEKDVIPHP
jgi:hypothetical protein